MTTELKAPVTPLEVVEAMATFEGFVPADFEVFQVPGFAARMPLLRERIKPKLTTIGELLAVQMSEVVGETLTPHVAQHIRRTVNAPEETWVAFSRSARAYKPFIHLRVAVSGEKVRVTVFVEDDSDDKEVFAANLERNAEHLALYLAHQPTIRAYEMCDAAGEPKFGSALNADALRAFAQKMKRIKGQHAVFGIQFRKDHPILRSGPEFLDAALAAAVTLKPLYDCGKPDFTYLYTPKAGEGIPPL